MGFLRAIRQQKIISGVQSPNAGRNSDGSIILRVGGIVHKEEKIEKDFNGRLSYRASL
jgi:hypothetical protein